MSEHVENLKAIRAALTDERRNLARDLARAGRAGAVGTLINMQNQIEAIDRMIAEEEQLAGVDVKALLG